jgi:DNA-binding response OmpR family regulator
MERILLVEDDITLAYGLEFTLRNEGFEVIYVSTLKAAREAYEKNKFSLILLDLKLPDGTGYDFCREIRETSKLPVIFLTACDEEVNIVLGLELGGDDYITKPFRIRELVSRIRAVLRRSSVEEQKSSEVLQCGNLKLNLLEGKLFKNSQEIVLTAMEYRLLLTLINHPKQVLTRNAILERLWDVGGEFVDDNTLSVYIRRLREKIEEDPAVPKFIATVRGLGYRWDCSVEH